MTPEGKVRAKVREILRTAKVRFVPIVGNGYGNGGAEDFACCVCGLYLAIECKSITGKGQTPLQQNEEGKVFRAGGVYVVVNENRYKALEKLIESMREIGKYVSTVQIEYEFKV